MNKQHILLLYPSYPFPRKSPPLGLAYLAAYLKKEGFLPYIYDLNISPSDNDTIKDLLIYRQWLVVGLSFMTNQFSEAKRLSSLIKDILPGTPLIAGGPHSSSIPERTLFEIPSIDIIVKGEGEETLKELVIALLCNQELETIHGLYLRKHNDIVKTPDRELIINIDNLPFPAWEYFDMAKYNVFHLEGVNKATTFALLSSRGCPNWCTFCDSHTIFARRYRGRSAQNIFAEIVSLNKTYGMISFDFVDDLFTFQKERVMEFCRLIEESGIPFRWMANARVNSIDREMLQAMKLAGCIRIDFGVESGDPNVRKLMKKNITDEQIIEAHTLAHELGISTGTFAMVGNWGETHESVKMTVDLLNKIGEDVMVSISCPYPGTELYRIAKEKWFINSEDWTRYVTSPTYSPNYFPVMRTEYLSEKDIIESFYYIHSFFAKRKFTQRYGRLFYLNPIFYKEMVVESYGIKQLFNMIFKILMVRVKRMIS